MKRKYLFLIGILILWLGMSYEGSRTGTTPPVVNRQMTLDEQIRAYELGLIGGIDEVSNDLDNRYDAPGFASQGNLIARTGRNIGNAIQTLVREILRGLVRFFDGIIS